MEEKDLADKVVNDLALQLAQSAVTIASLRAKLEHAVTLHNENIADSNKKNDERLVKDKLLNDS